MDNSMITLEEVQGIIDNNQFKICEYQKHYDGGNWGEKAIWKMGANYFSVEYTKVGHFPKKMRCNTISEAVEKYNSITL